MYTCSQRIPPADARTCISRERDGRRHICDDAKVEHKHMCRQNRHAKLHECRRCNRRCDDVVRRRGNAHAEYNRGNHGEEHRREQHAAGKLDEP